MRRARWLNSDEQLLVAPYYSVAEGQTARLILVNRFAESIDYEIQVFAPSGLSFPLGGDSLPSRGVVVLDLGEALSAAPEPFKQGSLVIRYFGDPEMTQAWVVLSSSRGSLEMPLAKATPASAREWISFWGPAVVGEDTRVGPRFAFHNAGPGPVVLTLSWRWADGDRHVSRRGLGPFQSFIAEAPPRVADSAAGSLVARHDGEPGQVAVSGFLAESGAAVAPLPIATPADSRETRLLEGLGFPQIEGLRAVVTVYDARASGDARTVRLSLVERTTGRIFTETEIALVPGSISALELSSLIPEGARQSLQDLRPRILAPNGDLLAWAITTTPDGSRVDSMIVPTSKIHSSGTYPVPSPETHEVTTTFLNLGEETAQVFGHFVSDRGEYALEPIEVPAGAIYLLDFQLLFSEAPTDRLGRSLDPDFDWGFFQWFARRGSKELLARTEARRRGESDTLGFNCFGCCAEFPSGAMIPESVAFDIGQTPSFEAVEFVDTCAGRMGPYYAFPDTLSYSPPLSWNGQTISTTDYANQGVSFQGSGEYMRINCTTTTRNFIGGGNATSDKCLKQHHPEFDPKKSCGDQTPNCSACYTCCDQQKAVGDCRCARLGSPKSCTDGVRASCQKCKQVCVGKHAETCDQQIVDCP